MKEKEIELLAERALDSACKEIQDVLFIKTGDLAGRYFSDEAVKNAFVGYIKQELAQGATLKSNGVINKFDSEEEAKEAEAILSKLGLGEIITIFYAGAGDDGGINDVDTSSDFDFNHQADEVDILDLARDLSQSLISRLFGAYYDGEPGGGGTVEFNGDTKKISISHYYNETTEHYEPTQVFEI